MFPVVGANTVAVKIDPNSTDVYVCGQLIPTSSWISTNAGPVHCDYVPPGPNFTTYGVEAAVTDKFPLR